MRLSHPSCLRACALTSALVATAAGACSSFGEDAPASDGGTGGGVDAGTIDAPAAIDGAPPGVEAGSSTGATSPCGTPTWDLCEDFDGDPAPAPGVWNELAGGSPTIALTVTPEQSHSAPRAMKVFASSPGIGVDKYLEATSTGNWQGISCQLSVRPEQIVTGETRLLWLRFTTSPTSDFAFGQAGVWIKKNGADVPVVLARSEAIPREGGGPGQIVTESTPIAMSAWRRVDVAIDFATGTLRLSVDGMQADQIAVPNIRPLTGLAVRMGATTNPPVGLTSVYVDDVACRWRP